MAIKAGIPPSSLQSAMQRNGPISLDMLFQISDVLDVPVTVLAGIEVPPEPTLEQYEEMAKNLGPHYDGNITINTTPDPEWVELDELRKKQEDGSITREELERAGELFKKNTKKNVEMLKQFQQRMDTFSDLFKRQIAEHQAEMLPIMLESLKDIASLIADLGPPNSQNTTTSPQEKLTKIPRQEMPTEADPEATEQ